MTEQIQDENKLIAQRRAKLAVLREQGPAFPNDFRRDVVAGELHAEYAERDGEATATAELLIVSRTGEILGTAALTGTGSPPEGGAP